MKAEELMTRSPACCTPSDTAQQATRLMQENDCGCIPVVEDMETRRLVGVVTDRDVAVRGVARGRGAETLVRELMSENVSCCTPESDASEVEQIMAERQVRRVPVIDEQGCCVGVIAQADLAREVSDREVARTVEEISEPASGSRSDADIGTRTRAPRE